jgi:hypothetical protein
MWLFVKSDTTGSRRRKDIEAALGHEAKKDVASDELTDAVAVAKAEEDMCTQEEAAEPTALEAGAVGNEAVADVLAEVLGTTLAITILREQSVAKLSSARSPLSRL